VLGPRHELAHEDHSTVTSTSSMPGAAPDLDQLDAGQPTRQNYVDRDQLDAGDQLAEHDLGTRPRPA
jgi:hypothetical protein